MVQVGIGADYWPPQKLEIDFDGTVPALSNQEVDYAQYPYSSTGSTYVGKRLYLLWPSEPAPELPYINISAVLTDRNGVPHYFPTTLDKFAVWGFKIEEEFSEALLIRMHRPEDLRADYFQEGNVMFGARIHPDYWPPQKLEIDFDGSIPLADFQEVDLAECPYLDQDHIEVCKVLFVLGPYADDNPCPIPKFSYGDVSGILVDRDGIAHQFP